MDRRFWSQALSNPELLWGVEFGLPTMSLSEWVARVPGLYWSEGAAAMRALASSAIELQSGQWKVYQPMGKSYIVLGGIGTLKFPTDENGVRLITLSGSHNASAGIPTLVFPEVWEHFELREGHVISIRAHWQKMAFGWAERFPSIRGIPRGYLVLNDPQQIEYIHGSDQPTEFHPCTVMEYSQGNVLLWDFVYATADTSYKKYRQELEAFFDEYKDKNERNGRYLLSADMNEPLWDADYSTPEQLRRAEVGAGAQLDLLEARIRQHTFKGKTIEAIVNALVGNFDLDGLKTLSRHIQVSPALWSSGGSSAQAAIQLMDICIDQNKVEELLDAMARQYPEIAK